MFAQVEHAGEIARRDGSAIPGYSPRACHTLTVTVGSRPPYLEFQTAPVRLVRAFGCLLQRGGKACTCRRSHSDWLPNSGAGSSQFGCRLGRPLRIIVRP